MIFDGGRESWEETVVSFRNWTPFQKRIVYGGLIAMALICAAVYWAIPEARSQSVLPDPALTPGVVASTDPAEVCGVVGGRTYSQRHRKTSYQMKVEVRRRYGAQRCGEIDHRVELSLGGDDAVENLWCEAGPPEPWSYKLKDRLEALVWRRVCRDHSMTLEEGRAVFLAPDWRAGYCALVGGAPCPP